MYSGSPATSRERPGAFKTLISDVESGHADFSTIIVYDVSRGGRFQDADESAYYEYLCKRADRALALLLDTANREQAVAGAITKFGRVGRARQHRGAGNACPARFGTKWNSNFFAAAESRERSCPRRPQGQVLNLASIGGLISIGGFGAYCAGKFAFEAWSDALRDEVAATRDYVT